MATSEMNNLELMLVLLIIVLVIVPRLNINKKQQVQQEVMVQKLLKYWYH